MSVNIEVRSDVDKKKFDVEGSDGRMNTSGRNASSTGCRDSKKYRYAGSINQGQWRIKR